MAGAVPEEQRSLYTQRVDDISPNIRYCAYNIGDMPTDINQLMAMRNISDMLASKINARYVIITYKAINSNLGLGESLKCSWEYTCTFGYK